MREIITLLVITFFGWIQYANAQPNYIMVNDTAAACHNNLIITGQTGNYSEIESVVSVDWGDGTNSLYTFSADAHSPFKITATHTYTDAGIYTTMTRVYNAVHDIWMDTTVYYQLTMDPSACGTIRIITKKADYPNYTYRDALVDFTDVTGKTTTISPHRTGYPSYYNYEGLDLYQAPYSVTLNPKWLQEHHLTQTSAPLTITSFNWSGVANPSTYQFLTTCAVNTTTIPDIKLENPMAYQFTTTGQKGYVHFDIRNLSCSDTLNATVSIDFPNGCLPVITDLTNPVINGNTLSFKVKNVRSYLDSASRTVPFAFPASTPPGTQFCFDIHISTPNESNLSDNSANVCTFLSNGYNPVNKLVNLNPIIDSQNVETFTYKINFQNSDIVNVKHLKILDSLSENLDLSTFKVISSSHGVSTYLDESARVVTFTFHDPDIVPDIYGLGWSQLEIIYSVSEKAGLKGGTVIDNMAYIYANYKPAIITNTTHNMNEAPLLLDELLLKEISIFPNPAQDKLYFSQDINEIRLYDASGKLVLEQSNILDDEISLNGLQSGFYQAVVKTNYRISTQKLVIKK